MRWDFIDPSGVFFSDYSFNGRHRGISDGVVTVSEISDGLERYWYCAPSGPLIDGRRFYSAGLFSEGLAAVKFGEDEAFSYIDKDGRITLKIAVVNAYGFHGGLARIQTRVGGDS
jgi:hypothetical protein